MAQSEATDSPNTMEQYYENYIMIDIGANLTNKKYCKDLDSVIQRALEAGVQKMMVIGTSVKSSREALRLTRIYPRVLYSTAGIHPHDAKSCCDESWQEIKSLAANPECVAIGECGLDFNKSFSEPDDQKKVFKQHIELAVHLNKPLFIHERDAHEELLEILDSYGKTLPPVIIHSFAGTKEQAVAYLNKGYYIGLTGYLCKDKSDTGVRQLLSEDCVPLERLLVETGSPFMYPNTRASKLPAYVKSELTERSLVYLNRYCTFQRNEPCSLPAIVEMIAAFMKKKPEEVALATSFNAMKLFGLSE